MKVQILTSVVGCLLISFSLFAQPTPKPAANAALTVADWGKVDALSHGTRIVVILKTGERRIGYFQGATAENITIDGGDTRTRITLAKPLIEKVSTDDPSTDGLTRGALVGAAGLLALAQVEINSCGKGCEYDGGVAIPLLFGAIGAGAGGLVGWLADHDAGGPEALFPLPDPSVQRPSEITNRFFPKRTTVRLGPIYRQFSFQSTSLKGAAAAPGIALAVQVSPRISVQMEYVAPAGRFQPGSGSTPSYILGNLVPASSRAAGFSRGIESRRVSYVLSELVGVHPPSWGRLRVALISGLGVQGQENRDYYDAYATTGAGTSRDPMRTNRIPGKYYVLDFHTPELGFVFGFDSEVAVGRGLIIVPTFRYNSMGDPGPSFAYGLGVHWRF